MKKLLVSILLIGFIAQASYRSNEEESEMEYNSYQDPASQRRRQKLENQRPETRALFIAAMERAAAANELDKLEKIYQAQEGPSAVLQQMLIRAQNKAERAKQHHLDLLDQLQAHQGE